MLQGGPEDVDSGESSIVGTIPRGTGPPPYQVYFERIAQHLLTYKYITSSKTFLPTAITILHEL